MKKKLIILMISAILILSIMPVYGDTMIYKVAGDYNFPPYEYVDDNGIYSGFNVDILKSISLVTNMNFVFTPMKWEDAYNSIGNGQADIIQGMKECPERKNKFLFSNSLLLNSQSIFVLKDNKSILGKKDLKANKIGLVKEDMVIREINLIGDIDIIEYDSLEEMLNSLLSNKVDAIIGNTFTMNYTCKKLDCIEKVKIVGDYFNEQKYAIAVGKDNPELLNKINEGVKLIQKNGMYDSLHRKWFGVPIKNAKEDSSFYFKILALISLASIFLIYTFNRINRRLKSIIESKTAEHRVLINELRHYDKMQFMDKIISSLAHEIRNPLTCIKLYTSQMKDKLDNKEFMLMASEDIPGEVDRIDGLIDEFLEYTSPRKPLIENMNIYKEMINSIKLIKLEMRTTKLILNMDDSLLINFDRKHFKQIILNILLNSNSATKGIENPTIDILTIEKDDKIEIIIEDNGKGMDEKDLPYIFEPFYTTKETGNGLGMFIGKQLVMDNGGSINAKSSKNGGMSIIISVLKLI